MLTQLKANQLEINAGDIIGYRSLTSKFHGDSGDRFLIAQDRNRGLRMMTADGTILAIKSQLQLAIITPFGLNEQS